MNKENKKKLKEHYKTLQTKNFEESLLMARELFYELFDYLNDKLETTKCNHDFSLTNKFLKAKNIENEKVLNFLKEKGAYCDCEVIFNVEEKFEE